MSFINILFTLLDVPSPPTGVRLSNIKSRSLEISWIGPHDGNSPILNYVIEYSNLPGINYFQINKIAQPDILNPSILYVSIFDFTSSFSRST